MRHISVIVLRPNQGFSLIEALIGMVVSTVVALSLAMLTLNSMKAQNNVMLTAGIDDFKNLLALQAGDPNACISLLGGSGTNKLVPSPQGSVDVDLTGLPALPTGVALDSVKPPVIQNLVAAVPTGPTTSWPAQLVFTLDKNAGNVIGVLQVTRTIPLQVTTTSWSPSDPNPSITGCIGLASSLPARALACTDMGGVWTFPPVGSNPPCQIGAAAACQALGGTYTAGPPATCAGAIISGGGPALWKCVCQACALVNALLPAGYTGFLFSSDWSGQPCGANGYGCPYTTFTCTKL